MITVDPASKFLYLKHLMKIVARFWVLLLFLVPTFSQAASWTEEGKAFLEKNKNRPGVTTTESGLQYRVMIKGEGPKPTRFSRVAVYYTGTLHDGTMFDSAPIIRPPVEFRVDRVIKGWTEALMLMPEGSMWEVVIPSELAYGPRGSGRSVPPNSVLIFEVELVEIR